MMENKIPYGLEKKFEMVMWNVGMIKFEHQDGTYFDIWNSLLVSYHSRNTVVGEQISPSPAKKKREDDSSDWNKFRDDDFLTIITKYFISFLAWR